MKKLVIIILFVFWSGTVFILGLKTGIDGTEKRLSSEVPTRPQYTAKEILDAVNNYRKEQKLKILSVDESDGGLCDGIVDRYLSFKTSEANKESNPGFDEWANKKLENGYKLISENFSGEFTKEKVIDEWINSPGANIILTNPNYNLGCSHTGDYGVVVVMGYK